MIVVKVERSRSVERDGAWPDVQLRAETFHSDGIRIVQWAGGNVHVSNNRACEHRRFWYLPCGKGRANLSRENVARVYSRLKRHGEARSVGGQRRRRGRRRSRIPTSILLIKVITLRTESANLILIDVKLRRYGGGGAVRRVRREGGGTRGCWRG